MNERDRYETATDLSLLKRRDSICERFEHDLKSGRSPRLESFLAEVSPGGRRGLLMDLLATEMEHRSRAGDRPSPNEYYHRFPEYPSVIASAIQHMMSFGNNLDGWHLRTPPKVELKSGEQIENFEIIRVLGRGQFAIVYLAQQLTVNREVALKVSQLRSDEHHNLAKVDGHPNIVRMYDHRSCEERGLQLVYMEVVRGGTLRDEIERTSNNVPRQGDVRARCERVWAIGPPLADALEYAHRNGVFHRDIKPANILLDELGNPKLADFNVAQRTNLKEMAIGGTLAYMSPEQLAACTESDEKEQDRKVKQLDGRSDIYSIGLVLWELVTLKRPFEVSDESDGLPPDVPEGVRQVLLRCLALDPADRYPSAGELARDLRLSAREDVQALIYPPKARWRELILRWPLAFLIVLGVLCNIGPSVLDITYNNGLLQEAGVLKSDEGYYTRWVLRVNCFAYGSAIMISAALAFPVIRALRALSANAPVARLPEAIARCHLLGHYVALVNFVVGAAASLAWAGVIGGQLWSNVTWSQWKTVHFAGSVFLSVMIAAPAAFFTITFTCSRVFLPRLARETRTWPTIDLEPRIRFHLLLLLFGPSVTITLFWWVKGDPGSAMHLLIWFCLLSFGAIQLGFTCASAIRSDLETLAQFRDGS